MTSPYQPLDPYYRQPQNPYPTAQPGYGHPQQGQDGYGYGYPQQMPMGAPPQTGEQNQLALAAVVIGFISVIGSLFCWGGLLGLPGIGVGIAAIVRSKKTGTGRNQAIGGTVLSALGVLILTVWIVAYVVWGDSWA